MFSCFDDCFDCFKEEDLGYYDPEIDGEIIDTTSNVSKALQMAGIIEPSMSAVGRVVGVIEPNTRQLARQYNHQNMICRKCYSRLPREAVQCTKKNCGRGDYQTRPKSKL